MKKITINNKEIVLTRNMIFSIICMILLIAFVIIGNFTLNDYISRILNNCAIYTVLGLSMNLINGFTGLFSLGHAGFMAIGAYVTALLTMTLESKAKIFYMSPLIFPFNKIAIPLIFALIIAGLITALFAFLIGAPVLRLRGDYLAIATLGFAEIIRVVVTNTQNITNGALGIKEVPRSANMIWTFSIAIFTTIIMILLIKSSYGKALKAIREDEVAAEAMGINLFKHKLLAFIIGAFFAGVGGGLLASILGTVNPTMFKFTITFNILLIIVLGGMGSITGTIISAFIVTIGQEWLRFLDSPMNLGFMTINLPGLRMVIFSLILVIVVIFFRRGIMGSNEFSWDYLFDFLFKKFKYKPLKKGE
ncbi:MAG: branched-chain amino acid ABC transporter permease [Oscillospiraceae bacterium]|nr:branched-chain amino acid ABC transporter permease [Oscillospiraceae bacterium]